MSTPTATKQAASTRCYQSKARRPASDGPSVGSTNPGARFRSSDHLRDAAKHQGREPGAAWFGRRRQLSFATNRGQRVNSSAAPSGNEACARADEDHRSRDDDVDRS